MEINAIIAKAKFYLVDNLILAIKSRDKQALKPVVLFGSMVLSMGFNFISSIISARLLGPSNYGDLKYILTVWSLLSLVITFGYFYAGSRALVVESDAQKSRELSGTIAFISFVMGLIICLVMLLIAYPLDYVFHVNVAAIMMQLAPLIIVIPMSQSLYLVLQSASQIYLLAILTAAPSILYVVFVLVLSALKSISTSSVLIAQQLSALIVIIYILIYTKPSLKSIKFWWGEIKKHHKSYGFPVYRGALAGVGSTYLTRLAISYWVDNVAIGFFSLASSLVAPLQLLPNAVATSSFRSFASKPRISKKVLLATIILSCVSIVLAFIFFGAPLSWIYTTKFNEVGPMARALGLGAIFIGFGDLFNRFLGAHGKGKSIQNAAYLNGIASVAGTLILVPIIGAWGAVLTTIIANGAYLLLMLISYRNLSRKIAPQPEH